LLKSLYARPLCYFALMIDRNGISSIVEYTGLISVLQNTKGRNQEIDRVLGLISPDHYFVIENKHLNPTLPTMSVKDKVILLVRRKIPLPAPA
jgi:hypothetical protein